MATLEELEDRIKQLEAEVLIQKEMIKKTLDFVQHAIDEQFEERRADEQRRLEEPEEKKEKALLEKMKELGYKPIKSKL